MEKNVLFVGSTHHPELAEKSDTITKEELDKLKNEKALREKNKNKANTDVVSVSAQIDTLLNKLKIKDENVKAYAEDIKKQFNDLKKDSDEICQTVKNLCYEILEQTINIDEFDFDEFREKYDFSKRNHTKKITEANTKNAEFSQNLEMKSKELEKVKSEYENAYKTLGFDNEEIYKQNIIDEKTVESTKKMIEDYKNKCVETSTRIKELSEQLKDKEKIDLEKDKEEFKNLENNMKDLKESQLEINSKYNTNKETLDSLMKNSDELIKQTELYTILDDLYKTASGNLSGKSKIEFEQYVQSVYFDMILIEANKRLVRMTSDRFKLVRKTKATKLNQNMGLELEVFDNYTGKQRDVKSLSGGESFKAALSLSLGVSDVIQSYSGGVVVDTLFIDEGFGSLDTESREQAIDTLNLLTSNNKLIGIISHVTELKERIDKKIIIEKTTDGSKIRFEV